MRAPRKKDYVQRAHSNPFTDKNIIIPQSPKTFDWSKHFTNNKQPDFLDLGCGYGKFLFFLAEKYKDQNVVGMEIRCKVANYVNKKIEASRYNTNKNIEVQEKGNGDELDKFVERCEFKKIVKESEKIVNEVTGIVSKTESHKEIENIKNADEVKDEIESKKDQKFCDDDKAQVTGMQAVDASISEVYEYDNIAVLHTNGMLFLQNFFEQNSLKKIFVLFPDPHFKKKKQKARIICKQMLDIFSFVLEMHGHVYVSTDVEEYFESMVECFQEHCDFVRVSDDLEAEITRQSDEALRAGVKTGKVFGAVYEKIA